MLDRELKPLDQVRKIQLFKFAGGGTFNKYKRHTIFNGIVIFRSVPNKEGFFFYSFETGEDLALEILFSKQLSAACTDFGDATVANFTSYFGYSR